MNAVRFTFLGQGLIRSNISACAFCKDLTPLTWSRAIVTTITTANKAPKSQTAEDFWDKNKRLKRPMSPHLTIYKPQVTSLLSVTHRGTGVFLATVVTSFSIGMLALPGSFPHYLSMIEAMHFGSFLIFLAKFGLAFPFLFHFCNGVRHLAWDLGYGFNLRDLYKSGYFVLGSSLVLATIAAAL